MLRVTPIDDVWVRVDADEATTRELSEYFTFEAPNARHMRRQERFKYWDGRIKLFKLKTRTLYRGLLPRIYEFAEARGYTVENRVPAVDPLWKESSEFEEVLESFGTKHEIRDYQRASVRHMLDTERCVILSPTGSGKSYIIYLATQLLGDCKTLIVVPTTGLVSQMVGDFRDYGYKDAIHFIQAGQSKTAPTQITVSTWQSIFKMDPAWFEQFDCVIVDEVHTAKSKSITALMEKCTKAPYRFGFTGTLDNMECHQLIIEGLFGSVYQCATTSELVKKKQLTKPKVTVVILEYPESVRKIVRRDCKQYDSEIDFLTSCGVRNKCLSYICRETKGPSLMLFQLVQRHGLVLMDYMKKLIPSELRDVWYIDGKTPAEERAAIKSRVLRAPDAILLASYGTTQLGINIPNLRNLIFAHPSKSLIRVLQSIGRVLRLDDGKDEAHIIDVVDDLRIGKHVNYAWKHAEERQRYYAAEGFKVRMKTVDLSKFAQIVSPTSQTDAGEQNRLPVD